MFLIFRVLCLCFIFAIPRSAYGGPEDVVIHRYFKAWLNAEGEVRRSLDMQSRELVFQPHEPPDIQLIIGSDQDGSFIKAELFHEAPHAAKAELLIHYSSDIENGPTTRELAAVEFSNSIASFFWRTPGAQTPHSLVLKTYKENGDVLTNTYFEVTGRPGSIDRSGSQNRELTRLAREHRDRRFQVNGPFQINVEEGSTQVHIFLVQDRAEEGPTAKVQVVQQEVVLLGQGQAVSLDRGEGSCYFSLQRVGKAASQVTIQSGQNPGSSAREQTPVE